MDPNKSNPLEVVRSSHIRSSVRVGSFGIRKNSNGGSKMFAKFSLLKLVFVAMLAALFTGFIPAAPAAAHAASAAKPVIKYEIVNDEVMGEATGNVAVSAPQTDGPQIAAATPLGFQYKGVSMGSGDQRLVLWDVTAPQGSTVKVTLTPQGKDPIVNELPVEAREYPGFVIARNVGDLNTSVHWKIEFAGQVVTEFDLLILKAPVHLSFTFTSETNCEGIGDYLKDPGVVAFLDGAAEPFYAQWLYAAQGNFGPFSFVTGAHTLVIQAFGKQNGSDDWRKWSELHGQLTVSFVSTCDQPQPVEELTISGVCPTPGVDSADLSLTGVFSRNGAPAAGEAVSINLPDGNVANVTTDANGKYGYEFIGAKNFVGKDISASAGTASAKLTITDEMFVSCQTPVQPVEGIVITGICPTPGQDSVDLTLNGQYVVDGQPVAGAQIAIALPTGESVNVTTDANGKFTYTFNGAKNFIGKDISASAGTASAKLTITDEMFKRCVTQHNPVNGVEINATCPTPGKTSVNLAISGIAAIDNMPVAGAVITLTLGNAVLAQVTTDQNGTFAYLLKDAKSHIGETIKASFGNASDYVNITDDLFTSCKTRGHTKVKANFSSYVQCAQLPADGNGNAPKGWVRNLVLDGLQGAENEKIITATVTADFINYVEFGSGTKVIGIDPRAYGLNQQLTAAWKVSYMNTESGQFNTKVFDRGFGTFNVDDQSTWSNYALVDELGRFVSWGGSKENKAEYVRVLEYNKWLCQIPTTTERKPEPETHEICTGLNTDGSPIIVTYKDGEPVPSAGDCSPKPQPKPRYVCAGLDKDGNKQYVPASDDSELDSPGCTAGDLVEETAMNAATSPNASGAALAMFGYLLILALIFVNWAKSVGLI